MGCLFTISTFAVFSVIFCPKLHFLPLSTADFKGGFKGLVRWYIFYTLEASPCADSASSESSCTIPIQWTQILNLTPEKSAEL